MERVLVIGCSAAGKSTVARRLGEILGIEVIHMDKEMWKPGCRLSEPEEEKEKTEALLKKDRWIIDGNYTVSLPQRLERADTVVMIDFPRWLCLVRAFKRLFTHFGKTRPDMAHGCPEQFNWAFLKWIWRYPQDERPELIRQLNAHGKHARFIALHGQRQTDRFLAELERESRGTSVAPAMG